MLLIDVGNSRIKLVVADQHHWLARHSLDYPTGQTTTERSDRRRELCSLTASLRARFQVSQAAIATVQPDHTNDILSCLQAEGIEQVTVLRSDGSLFRSGLLTHDIGTPETIGVDRLLGLLGARKEFPQGDIITVDFGSAVTVNWMTHQQVFKGGAILPGFRTMARSLRQQTAALPEVAIPEASNLPARETQSAIAQGVLYAVLGGVERIIADLYAQVVAEQMPTRATRLDDLVHVVITGGHSELAERELRLPRFVRRPDLVLSGLHAVVNP